MRNRTIGINVRVSENEKKKSQRNAKKSNLNLSSYCKRYNKKRIENLYANPI